MSELEEFKKVVSPIAYGLAYKSELGTTEYQQLYAEEDVIKYFNNKPSLTIPKSIAEQADKTDLDTLFEWGKQEFYQWFNHEQDEYMPIIYAYLAGKALGVDLVKVVDDDNY